jgi:5S rRNA maturation endonuclease (ribonuclease M5)
MPQPIYNAQWAKENIAMPDLLAAFGHEPLEITKSGNEYWYISPFRYEKEPSFHTSYLGGKWIWNDFGRGDIAGSGTVIGFLELHENVNVSEALQILKNLFSQAGTSSWQHLKTTPLFKNIELSKNKAIVKSIEEKLVITQIKETIWDKNLIGYLAGERCINHKLALKYLKHIKYTNVQTGKSYDTIGFVNESGDYECRDKYFKGILKAPDAQHRNTAKDISYIPGTNQKSIAVFEGFIDFLTILTIKDVAVLPVDVIVLNMVNMRRRAIDFIKQANYQQVFTFFDNDDSGEKTTQLFIDELEGMVKPQSHLYTDFKDYNQFLQQRAKKI